MNPDELDLSVGRLLDREDSRTRTTGLGTTKQGHALARQYRQPLVDRITEDRTYGRRDRDVWRALKGIDDNALAITLLVAGISVSEPGELGADDNGEKNYRDQARWIGRNFGQQRELGLKVGAWGINMLQSLPAFALDTGDVLDTGPDFKTRLPITFDGSCSGLQHLCAMTRADEGRYVNLVADDEADDFYRRVAFRTWQATHNLLPDIMNGPFDREIVKQPAMSYFYGSRPGGFARPKKGDWKGRWRPYGMTKQVIDVLKERKQSTKDVKELAHAIYKAIGDMVPRATAVR
jgi:hypothetical protein